MFPEIRGHLTVTIVIAVVLSLLFGLASLMQLRRRRHQQRARTGAGGPPYRVADPFSAPAAPVAPSAAPAGASAATGTPAAPSAARPGKAASVFRQLDGRGEEMPTDAKAGSDVYIWE